MASSVSYRYYGKYVLHKEAIITNFSSVIERGLIAFDRNHVVMTKQYDPNYPTYLHNPTGIANYGLLRYNDLIENTNKLNSKVDSKVAIDKQVRWLIKNRIDTEDMSFWYYNFPVPDLGCEPPWKSAMSQGLILSLLLRVYHLTRKSEYSELAERVALSMKTPTSEGGFLYIDSQGDYWYQEYMGNYGYVLNGFIYAMWGVYDYYLYSNDEEYKMIFDRCIDTLRKNLEKYDWKIGIPKWSVYDLKDKNPVNLFYHKLHISLLRDLYAVTKEKFLLVYANRWETYISQPNMLLVSLTLHARAQVLAFLGALSRDRPPV
jgi:heparosan-N-sulfate-glucuronate 5-epimerase